MIKLSQDNTKELLAIHGWSGVLLGLLLYAVICTGVIAVFADEIGGWSDPLSAPTTQGLPFKLETALKRSAAETDPKYYEELLIFPMPGGRINMLFHGHEHALDAQGKEIGPEIERGSEFEIEPHTQQTLARRDGLVEEIAQQRQSGALARFFIELHVRLHLPNPWGLFLTGILGLMMMIAAVTGFLVHRHLIKELFTLRRQKDDLLRSRDAHVIAGTWNLPFAFLLAFTGSFFSFASSVGLPAMAMVVFGGDEERAVEEVFGVPPASDPTPATPADFDAILADVQTRGHGVAPDFAFIRHYGRADASVQFSLPAREGEMIGRAFTYSMASGAFQNEKPVLVGKEPSLGNDVAALMTPLHFGNFAGVLSKSVWFALGFAGAYVTLSGLMLWVRRRHEQRAWQRMSVAVHWVGYGLPLALALTPYGNFVARILGTSVKTGQYAAFLGAALLTLLVALWLRPLARVRSIMLVATGIALLLLPAARLLCGGMGWPAAWHAGQDALLAIDLALLLAGAFCLYTLRRPRTAAVDSADATANAIQA